MRSVNGVMEHSIGNPGLLRLCCAYEYSRRRFMLCFMIISLLAYLGPRQSSTLLHRLDIILYRAAKLPAQCMGTTCGFWRSVMTIWH